MQFDLDARVAMPQLPIAASYAIVFATLAVFGVVAVAGLKMSKLSVTDKDSYFTARNSQSTFSLAMTFFASGMGAWVLFAVAEVGTYTGSLGVAGYALSAIAPLIILDRVSPFLRRELPNGVTLHDFVALVRTTPRPARRAAAGTGSNARARARAAPHPCAPRASTLPVWCHNLLSAPGHTAQRCRVRRAIMANGGRLRSHSSNLTRLAPA